MKRNGLCLLLLSWVFLQGVTQAGLIGPNRSTIEMEFGLSHSVFGLAVAVIQCFSACVMMVVVQRLRQVKPLIVLRYGLCLQSIGYFLVMRAHSYLGLMFGWMCVILGVTTGAITNNLSMRLFANHPRKGVLLLHSFNAIGKVAGPLLAAICLTMNWRNSFLTVGITTSILCLYTIYAQSHIKTIPDAASYQIHRDNTLFRRPLFWLSILPFGLIGGGEMAFATLMPTYFHEVQGVTKPIASILLTIHLLGIAAGRLCSVPLNRRISNHMLIGGCLLAGLAIFPVLTCHSPFVLYPALFLVGVMFSCVWPTYFAQVSQFYQGDQDFFAYSALLGDAIGTAGCVYISSLIADFSLPFSLLFCTGVFWLFGLLYFSSRLSRSPVHSSEHTASIPETSE